MNRKKDANEQPICVNTNLQRVSLCHGSMSCKTNFCYDPYIHCSKELKDHPNAETQIFHFADPSVFVLLQLSAYILTT